MYTATDGEEGGEKKREREKESNFPVGFTVLLGMLDFF